MRVEVLAYPGCFASEVYGIPDLLLMAHHRAAGMTPHPTTQLQAAVVGARRRVSAAGGLDLTVERARERDILVIPGFEFTQSVDLDELLQGLRPEIDLISDHARSGALIVSVCVGAFLLAEAGVLDGRRATTSWLFAQRLAHRYPAVIVDADAIVVSDAGVTTSAGFSAMYDVALTLVQREHGPDVARSVARLALVDDARSSQTPYVDVALLRARDSEFVAVAKRLLEERLDIAYELADVARGLHVSPRTLLRRFKRDTGLTPLQVPAIGTGAQGQASSRDHGSHPDAHRRGRRLPGPQFLQRLVHPPHRAHSEPLPRRVRSQRSPLLR